MKVGQLVDEGVEGTGWDGIGIDWGVEREGLGLCRRRALWAWAFGCRVVAT